MDILVGDFVFQEILFPLKLTIDINCYNTFPGMDCTGYTGSFREGKQKVSSCIFSPFQGPADGGATS